MRYFHLVARAWSGWTPLADPVACAWLWRTLSRAFDKTLASTLLPNHVHLVAGGNADKLRLRLASALRNFSRVFHPRERVWEPVPPPAPLPDKKHLLRTIRYVHLNPCRDGLVRDPLAWEWSTHLDWTGHVADPWPDLSSATSEIDWSKFGIAEKIHRYVSGDPTVDVNGTPLRPRDPPDLESRLRSPELVRRAVEIAFRAHPASSMGQGPLRGRAIRFMLARSGLLVPEVARLFGIAPQTAWTHAQSAPDPSDEVITRILRDDRVLGSRRPQRALSTVRL